MKINYSKINKIDPFFRRQGCHVYEFLLSPDPHFFMFCMFVDNIQEGEKLMIDFLNL